MPADNDRLGDELIRAVELLADTFAVESISYALVGGKTMTRSITAVFEGGLLRPMTPLALAEGTRVELIVISDERNDKQAGRTAAGILAGIAALPTSGGDPRTSQDHDQVLYGEPGAR